MKSKNKEVIKIGNKEEWIDLFCKNVEEIKVEEDYLKKNYMIEKEMGNKTELEVIKGKYYPEKDSIKLILICCKFSFYNDVIAYEGKFENKENDVYLIGCCRKIYPEYLKELKKFKFAIIVMFAFIIMISYFINFKEVMFSIGSIIVFLIIMWIIDKKISYMKDYKKLIKWLKEISERSMYP